MYEKIVPPSIGSRITFKDGKLIVPDDPIIPFIGGDGTGIDIWLAIDDRQCCRPLPRKGRGGKAEC